MAKVTFMPASAATRVRYGKWHVSSLSEPGLTANDSTPSLDPDEAKKPPDDLKTVAKNQSE